MLASWSLAKIRAAAFCTICNLWELVCLYCVIVYSFYEYFLIVMYFLFFVSFMWALLEVNVIDLLIDNVYRKYDRLRRPR